MWTATDACVHHHLALANEKFASTNRPLFPSTYPTALLPTPAKLRKVSLSFHIKESPA